MNNNGIEKYILDNGLTVLIENLDQFQSVSMGLFLKKGSRDEDISEAGYSHFCEHMIFKGTPGKSKTDIAEISDEMGGYLNAFTNQELICIYNRVPEYNMMKSCEMMFKMFNESVFDAKEMELERQVILNEINSVLEDPQDKLHEDFMENMFPGQPLGRPVIGNIESVNEVNRDTLYGFYEKTFCSDNLVAVFCGKVDTGLLLSFLEKLNFRRSQPVQSGRSIQGDKLSFFSKIPSEQLHLVMGTSKFELEEDLYYKSGIFNLILGESMSSILFQKIREEAGLCYTIFSGISFYRNENIFDIYSSVLPKNSAKITDAINKVISELKKNGISTSQLDKAKMQKTGEIYMNSDLVSKRMNRMAMTEIKFGRIYDQKFILDMIYSSTVEDMWRLINKIFKKENFIIQGLYKNHMELGLPDF